MRDAVWTEAHLLVTAAYQLHKWGLLVTSDDEEARPRGVELLAELRNSTEHLDAATLTLTDARGSKKSAWSIEKLPGGRLSLAISLEEDPPKIFDLVSVDEIETYAVMWSEAVLYYLEPDLSEAIDLQIDTMRDK